MSAPSSSPLPSSLRSSLYSACYGVAASITAKYSLADEWTLYFVERTNHLADHYSLASSLPHWSDRALFWFFRLTLLALQLFLNSCMLHHFVRSMRASSSLLAATYNQCFMIVLAGLSGYLCFQETLPKEWFVGVLFIMAGVVCVQWGNSEDETSRAESKTKQKLQPTKTSSNAKRIDAHDSSTKNDGPSTLSTSTDESPVTPSRRSSSIKKRTTKSNDEQPTTPTRTSSRKKSVVPTTPKSGSRPLRSRSSTKKAS